MKLLRLLILTLACILPWANCVAGPQDSVRVAIIQEVQSLSLKIKGFYEIRDAEKKKVLYWGRNLKTTVTVYNSGVLIAGKNFIQGELIILATGPDIIFINGRAFRGKIYFIRNAKDKLLVVNYIGLEEYIKGVLYHEASHFWPMEALKAQAVASRTYAVYQKQENKNKDFDVTSDIYSQVYGGKTSERFRTNKAVDETEGQILTFKGKVFSAYFHATCAGYTEDASLLWNVNISPLKGVVCLFCKYSPHFKWHYVSGLKEIEDKLNNAGYGVYGIQDIRPQGQNRSGRIRDLRIVSQTKEIKISAKEFRSLIGPNLIRSTRFGVKVFNSDAVFEGYGWGHGVGLCQWGAYFMAKQGFNYKQILTYYYPQSDVKAVGF